jgi:hypothetical protein
MVCGGRANLDVALGIAELLTQKLRQKHQVVIMDPNIVVISHVQSDFFGKNSVDCLISHSGRVVRYHFILESVQYRPQNLICSKISVRQDACEIASSAGSTRKPIVMMPSQGVRQPDRNGMKIRTEFRL